MGNRLCLKLYIGLFCLCLLWLLSPVHLVRAASRDDLAYYGDRWHSRLNLSYNSSANRYSEVLMTIDDFACCFAYLNENDVQTLCIFSPRDFFIQYRHVLGGQGLSFSNYAPTVAYGTLNSSIVVDGVRYYYEIYESSSSSFVYADLPLMVYDDVEINLELMVRGINQWYLDQKGGEINADVSVDLTNIEDSLADLSASNSVISASSSDILTELQTGLTMESAFDVFAKDDLHALRVILGCLFIVMVAQLFRNVLSQWLHNTGGR